MVVRVALFLAVLFSIIFADKSCILNGGDEVNNCDICTADRNEQSCIAFNRPWYSTPKENCDDKQPVIRCGAVVTYNTFVEMVQPTKTIGHLNADCGDPHKEHVPSQRLNVWNIDIPKPGGISWVEALQRGCRITVDNKKGRQELAKKTVTNECKFYNGRKVIVKADPVTKKPLQPTDSIISQSGHNFYEYSRFCWPLDEKEAKEEVARIQKKKLDIKSVVGGPCGSAECGGHKWCYCDKSSGQCASRVYRKGAPCSKDPTYYEEWAERHPIAKINAHQEYSDFMYQVYDEDDEDDNNDEVIQVSSRQYYGYSYPNYSVVSIGIILIGVLCCGIFILIGNLCFFGFGCYLGALANSSNKEHNPVMDEP